MCAFPAIFIGYSTPSKAWRYYIPSRRKAGTSQNIIFDECIQSLIVYHNIEGELAATKTSTYHGLLVPNPAFKSNIDNDDIAPPKVPTLTMSSHPPSPTSPQQHVPPLPNHPVEPVEPLGPSPSIPKPSRRGCGPAKIYEKTRSSQRLQACEKSTLDATKATNGPDKSTPDKNSDDKDDEAQVHEQLE